MLFDRSGRRVAMWTGGGTFGEFESAAYAALADGIPAETITHDAPGAPARLSLGLFDLKACRWVNRFPPIQWLTYDDADPTARMIARKISDRNARVAVWPIVGAPRVSDSTAAARVDRRIAAILSESGLQNVTGPLISGGTDLWAAGAEHPETLCDELDQDLVVIGRWIHTAPENDSATGRANR
jgi:hypothetical protein